VSWSRPFHDPIPVPKGKPLLILKDAAAYILKLPKAKQKSPEWQTAGEALLMAAEDRGPMMHARIGVMQALKRCHVREFKSEGTIATLGSAQVGEGPMTPRIRMEVLLLFASVIVAFEPFAGAAAAPPAAQMQYPGARCDRWEQECAKFDGPQTEHWYDCMNQPRAKYDCQDPAGYVGYPPPECEMWRHECARSYGSAPRKYRICLRRREALAACGRY